MNKFISIITAIIIFYTSTFTAYAGLDSDVEGFLDDLGVMSNMQMPGSFNTSSRGVYSGGALSMRFKNSSPPLVTFQPPSVRVSCSGLDLNAGLISILNLDMIQRILQQGGTSLAWGLLIGLAYSLPTVSGVFEKIQKYTRWLQMLQGDMCQIGKNIGSAIGDRMTGKYEKDKKGKDVASGAAGTFEETMDSIFNNPTDFAKSVRGNIVYDAINGMAGASDETVRAMMSIFGTVAWNPTSDLSGSCTSTSPETEKVFYYPYTPTLASKPTETINALLFGDNIDIYTCGTSCGALGVLNNTCTNLQQSTVHINGIITSTQTTLESAITKLVNGSALTVTEMTLLDTPVIPQFQEYVLYLVGMSRKGADISRDVQLLAVSYGYLQLQQLLTYISDSINKNKTNLLAVKELDSETRAGVEKFFADYKTANTDLSKVLKEQSYEYVNTLTTSGGMLSIFKTGIKNELTPLANSRLSGGLGSLAK
jgi:conjugative transfer pilus assembly protein TraH